MGSVAVNSTVFNPIQQHLLMMFSHMDSEEQLLELKSNISVLYSISTRMSMSQFMSM